MAIYYINRPLLILKRTPLYVHIFNVDFIILVADCYDVYKAKKSLPGIYTLQPDSHHTFNAHCLQDGWTVIQSRGQFGNPKDYFLRKWDAYVKGFGEPGTVPKLNKHPPTT